MTSAIKINFKQVMDIRKSFSPELLSIIKETARKCFGNLPVVNHRTGNKYLQRKPIARILNNYYYTDGIANNIRKVIPDYKTDIEERRKEKLEILRRRGSGPPKKGQGKRAMKRK